MNWQELKQSIIEHQSPTASWVSDQKSLVKIIEKAEEWNIPSDYAGVASLSNLRVMITECKRAIRWNDRAFLESTFVLAGTETNINLRLRLHIPDLEPVAVERQGSKYRIEATQEQYDRIRKATCLQHEFHENHVVVQNLWPARVTEDTYADVQ
jgi:hypothetical protein